MQRHILNIIFVIIGTAACLEPVHAATFDLAQLPGSYVVATKGAHVEVIVDRPEVLEQAVDTLPDSSPMSPPLDTDDTGTTEPHSLEVNLVTECDKSLGDQACIEGVDASVGLSSTTQLRVDKYLTQDRSALDGNQHGHTATDVGVKYRFYDHNGTSLALFPGVELNDALPRDGHVIYLPLIVSQQIGKQMTGVINAGATRNIEHPDQSFVNLSAAIGRALSPSSKIMGEVSTQRSKADKITYARFGWVKVVYDRPTSRYQTSIFTSVGRTVGQTPEHSPRYVFRLGLHFLLKPPTE